MGHWKSFWEEGHLHRGLEEARTVSAGRTAAVKAPIGGLCWCSGKINACALPVQARWRWVGVSLSSSQLGRKPVLCSECTRKPEKGLNRGARICNFEGPLGVGADQAVGEAGTERAFAFPAIVQVGDGETPQLWGCNMEGELRGQGAWGWTEPQGLVPGGALAERVAPSALGTREAW